MTNIRRCRTCGDLEVLTEGCDCLGDIQVVKRMRNDDTGINYILLCRETDDLTPAGTHIETLGFAEQYEVAWRGLSGE